MSKLVIVCQIELPFSVRIGEACLVDERGEGRVSPVSQFVRWESTLDLCFMRCEVARAKIRFSKATGQSLVIDQDRGWFKADFLDLIVILNWDVKVSGFKSELALNLLDFLEKVFGI